jgi:hypothetical protein
MIKKGKYVHYKGKQYEVIGTAMHSETMEDMIVYKPLYNSISELWVRPAKMFSEEVKVDGKRVPRFKLISN